MVRREDDLNAPGRMDFRYDPRQADVIAHYENESNVLPGSTKAGVPQTIGNYLSHLAPVFAIARPRWKYPLDKQQLEDAVTVFKTLGTIKKANQRNRRPSLEELDRLLEHFGGGQDRLLPNAKDHGLRNFSTSKQEEITLLA